ncbi:unnamed protein product [Prunus armeniaca]
MVIASQLALTQSPISSLISSVGNTVSVKLDDTNYVTWNFQMELLLRGNGILGFVDGSFKCRPQFLVTEDGSVLSDEFTIWTIHDTALMTLITATLLPSAISCVIGCSTSNTMWVNLRERFASVTRESIFQLKTDLQNIKKG